MKPIVIYLDKNEDEVKLTRKEFEEYIDRAYKAGYDSGYADGKKYYPWWYGNNTITATNTGIQVKPLDIKYTGKEYNPNYTEITCNSDKAYNSIGGSITGTTSVTVTNMQTKEQINEKT